MPRITESVRDKKGGLMPGWDFLQPVPGLCVFGNKIFYGVLGFQKLQRSDISRRFRSRPYRGTGRQEACLEFALETLGVLLESA
jgi:hypothetical protein